MCTQKTSLKNIEKRAKVLSAYEASRIVGGLWECHRCNEAYSSADNHKCKGGDDPIIKGLS